MYLDHEKFMYKFGISKVNDFVHPKVLDATTVVLPYYNFIHYFNPSREDDIPTRNHPLFKFIKQMYLYPQLEYNNKNEYGKLITFNENNEVKKYKERSPDFKVAKQYEFKNILKRKYRVMKMLIGNVVYSEMDKHYKYQHTPIDDYYRFDNNMRTLFHNFKEVDELVNDKKKLNGKLQQYWYIELPDQNYNISIVEKFLRQNKITMEYMKLFHDDKYLTLMELYKMFDPDTACSTVLKYLNRNPDENCRRLELDNKAIDTIKHINLILYTKGKVVFFNLYTFLSFNKEYGLDNNARLNSEQLINLFFYMIKNIYSLPAFTPEEIDSNKYELGLTRHLNNKISKKASEKDLDDNDIKDIIKDNKDSDLDLKKVEKENKKDYEDIISTTKYKNKYEDIDDIKDLTHKNRDELEDIKKELEELYENKYIDKKKYTKLIGYIDSVLNKPSPWKDGKKIKDLLKIDADDLELTEEEKKLPKPNVLFNEKDAADTLKVFNSKYIEKIYKKDIIRCIFAMQKTGMIIKDIRVNTHEDIMGSYEEYEIEVSNKGGTTNTVRLRVPLVNKDGYIAISNNLYNMRIQRADVIIKKISPKRVSLNTGYGKLFVDKAPKSTMDTGYSIKKQLNDLVEAKKIKNLVSGSIKLPEVKLPIRYAQISRYIKTFMYDKYYFNFNYPDREDIADKLKIELSKIEKDKYILIGYTKTNEPLVIDNDNIIYIYKSGKYNKVDEILDLLNIDKTKLKTEYSLARIFKEYVPIIYMLCYYMGLKKTLHLLKVKYDVMEGNKQVNDVNTIKVKFKYHSLFLYPENDLHRMILEGFNHYKKIIKDVDIDVLNNKEQYTEIWHKAGLPLNIVTRITLMEQLFIDPISKTILEGMKEPTTFVGLLIRSSELLLDDSYMHPGTIKGFNLKAYSRIPQFVYMALVEAIEKKTNEEFFGRSRFNVDPYRVWRLINEDSSVVLSDDTNPIANLKQKEDVTYLGAGGRMKESMSKETRILHPDDIGVISEGAKDNGDVGINAYLSANPLLGNLRGIKDLKNKEMVWSNILSTNTMLTPFALHDDPKRVNYSNIQASHVVSITNPKVYPVRTGYDSVIPYKLDKKFVGWAEDEGTVSKVTKHSITVTYKKKGKKTYSFSDWTSKEESGTTYVHKMVPNVKEGQKVKYADILYYDQGFFEPDMFDKTKVTYRASTNVRVAFNETQETFEDAVMISEKLSTVSKINFVKVRSLKLKNTDKISDVVKIGTELKPTDSLFYINTNVVGDDKLDKKTLDLLQGFVKGTPKAKYKGKLIKIQVYYNCEYKDLTPSLKKLVDVSKPYMVDPLNGKIMEGKVNSGYSVDGKPLQEGELHIKFFINLHEEMNTGDKGIFANQLKTTITTVYDYPIVNEHKEEIDAVFSQKGVLARIVNSPGLMGTTATLLDIVSKKAVKMYFG